MRRPSVLLVVLASAFISWSAMADDTFIAYTNRTYLPVSFEYPAGWKAEPSSGSTESYTQVQVYAPDRPEDGLRTYLVVRIVPPKERGGKYASLGELVAAYRSTLLSTLEITGQRQIVVLGAPATLLELRGGLRLPWESKDPKFVPVKGQRVFLERDGRFYELAWLTSIQRGPEIEQVFSHLLSSLTPYSS